MRIILALSAAVAAFASVPAMSAPQACDAAPAALRAAAAQAEAVAQRKALADVTVGEKLCEAGNRFEATRKFRTAARTLKLDLATLLNGTTATAEAQQ